MSKENVYCVTKFGLQCVLVKLDISTTFASRIIDRVEVASLGLHALLEEVLGLPFPEVDRQAEVPFHEDIQEHQLLACLALDVVASLALELLESRVPDRKIAVERKQPLQYKKHIRSTICWFCFKIKIVIAIILRSVVVRR